MTNNRIKELTRKLGYHQQLGTHFKRIFESIPDGLICADREGRIIMVNPCYLKEEIRAGY